VYLPGLQEAKVITGEGISTRWVLWDVSALDFSFVKLDGLRCCVRASSGQRFPKDQYSVRDIL